MDDYVCTIGLEVHVQLKTRTKAFCGCAVRREAAPNTLTCPVCLGHPGTLPVLNAEALRLAVKAALALGCDVAAVVAFDRKNYFYADLPKGFQISQHFGAIGLGGEVELWGEEGFATVPLERVHLEEDVAKAVHDEAYVQEGETLLDFNRAGVPLLEVVSRPVLSSPAEARRYVVALRQTLVDNGISDCEMEHGALRIDTNISVASPGAAALGTQVEIKNLNSTKAMEEALLYEARRQAAALAEGREVRRETRLFDERAGVTRTMRVKETRADYRFFPEPDLPSVALTPDYIRGLRGEVVGQPAARVKELMEGFGATVLEAEMLAFSPWYYRRLQEAAAVYDGPPRNIVNWLVGDVTRELKARGLDPASSPLTGESLASLLTLLDRGVINTPAGREVLGEIMTVGGDPAKIVNEKNLGQVSDVATLEALVRAACEANPQAVADLRAGKDKARAALVGYVMKNTRGKANPVVVNDCIDRLLRG